MFSPKSSSRLAAHLDDLTLESSEIKYASQVVLYAHLLVTGNTSLAPKPLKLLCGMGPGCHARAMVEGRQNEQRGVFIHLLKLLCVDFFVEILIF